MPQFQFVVADGDVTLVPSADAPSPLTLLDRASSRRDVMIGTWEGETISVAASQGRRLTERELRYLLLRSLPWVASAVEEEDELIDAVSPPGERDQNAYLNDPHTELYPPIWDGHKMRPEVKQKLEDYLLRAIADGGFNSTRTWLKFTAFGSGASYNWDESGDFDVHIWIDVEAFNAIHPDLNYTSDQLLVALRRLIIPVNSIPLSKITDKPENKMAVQYYPLAGKGTKDECLATRPYACYDMQTDEWFLDPKPITPDFYGEWFLLVEPKARLIANQANSILDSLDLNQIDTMFWGKLFEKYKNPKYQQQANNSKLLAEQDWATVRALWKQLFDARQEAYSPEGGGLNDERDMTTKILEVWGVGTRLKERAYHPLPWQDQELPAPPPGEDPEPTPKFGPDRQDDPHFEQTNAARKVPYRQQLEQGEPNPYPAINSIWRYVRDGVATTVIRVTGIEDSSWPQVLGEIVNSPYGPMGHELRLSLESWNWRVNNGLLIPEPDGSEQVPLLISSAWHLSAYENIQFVNGDITQQPVDAIVNAANSQLRPGAGVDGAIRAADGGIEGQVTQETSQIGGCPTGDAVTTSGGQLPAKWIIHAVGPIWVGGENGEAADLASAYHRAMEEAAKVGARSIAFPALSCGIYMFPTEQAAQIALDSLEQAMHAFPEVSDVRMVFFDPKVRAVFDQVRQGGAAPDTLPENWSSFDNWSEEQINELVDRITNAVMDGDRQTVAELFGILSQHMHPDKVNALARQLVTILENPDDSYPGATTLPPSWSRVAGPKERFKQRHDDPAPGTWWHYSPTGEVWEVIDPRSDDWLNNNHFGLGDVPVRIVGREYEVNWANRVMWNNHIAAGTLVPIEPQQGVQMSLGKTATWTDVAQKAQRLREQGSVHILRNAPDMIVGRVDGDHGTYTTQIWRDDPNSLAITEWDCECQWSDFSWQRTRQWKKYEGRPCSHVLALFWEALGSPVEGQDDGTGGDQGGDVVPPAQPAQPGQPAPDYVDTSLPPPPLPYGVVSPGTMPAGPPIPGASNPPLPGSIGPPPAPAGPPSMPAGPPPGGGATSKPTEPGQGGTVAIPGALSSWKESKTPPSNPQDPSVQMTFDDVPSCQHCGSTEFDDYGVKMYPRFWCKRCGAGRISLGDRKSSGSSWKYAAFVNGDTVRAEKDMQGLDRDNNTITVPRNSIGEVLSSDAITTIAIFPLRQNGPLEPHLVKVEDFTSNFVRSNRANPFIRRRT